MATCETCRWWVMVGRVQQTHAGPVETYRGECRVRSTAGPFPHRERLDWCGEHTPQPTEARDAS